ncbi:MAG: four helix bundle protein [Terriglobales bacterium]|jgi:four helix bundle protein
MADTFRNLIAWQKAKKLVKDVYVLTQKFPKEEMFGLSSQLRRAVVSIPSNIAEGKGRVTSKDFCHFLVQARGSLFEAETQLELSRDLGYLSDSELAQAQESCDELGKILHGLINSLK